MDGVVWQMRIKRDPALKHLFGAGKGHLAPAEYPKAENIAQEAIDGPP